MPSVTLLAAALRAAPAAKYPEMSLDKLIRLISAVLRCRRWAGRRPAREQLAIREIREIRGLI
jgi:hypothetical protein